jgi:hypothetical protein
MRKERFEDIDSPDERVIASRLSMIEQESGFFLSQK